MSNNRLKGELRQTKGSIKEAIGKITGDKQTELEGTAEKQAGKIQSAIGKAAHEIRKKK